MSLEFYSRTNIRKATYEAVYWWDRHDEFYYQAFMRFLAEDNNGDAFDFFIDKVFKRFLADYSVRRNLKSSKKDRSIERTFVQKLKQDKFFARVLDGDTLIIDDESRILKDDMNKLTNGRHSRSLLSKIAALVNPSQFILVDTLTTKTLRKVASNFGLKVTNMELYSSYLKTAEESLNVQPSFLEYAEEAISSLPVKSHGYHYFSNHPEALRLKVLDKLLWILNTKSGEELEAFNEGFVPFSILVDQS